MKHTVIGAFEALRPGVSFQVDLPFRYEDITIMSVPHKSFVDVDNLTIPTEQEINDKIAELDAAEPMRLLRKERDRLLVESDWTQFSDVPEATRTAWQTYRQQLRDLPAHKDGKDATLKDGVLENVKWPQKPA